MKFRLPAIAAALCFAASTPVWSAINAWTGIGPAGGTVNKIVYNPSTPNIVYAIAVGGFYRSQDGGVSWQLTLPGFYNSPQDLAIDPSNPSRVYVVEPNYPYLYVSTDAGASLTAVTTLPAAVTTAWQIAVSQNGSTVYLTSGMQVFRSTDRTASWQQRTSVGTYSAARVLHLSIDPTDANTLYASATTSATDSGVFASHDGAMTWQLLTSGAETTSLSSGFAINAANSSQIWSAQYDGVWFSNNKGVSWTNEFSTGVTAIAIDPSNPSVLYVGTPYGRVFRTADAGSTWTDVSGSNSAGQFTCIAVNPAQSAQVLTGGLGGLSGTSTSGTSWSTQTAGLDSTTILGLSADPVADRIYMNVSSGGVYFSSAGGVTTAPVNNLGSGGLLQLSGQSTLNVWDMLAQPGQLSASLLSGMARSTDGGSTWSVVQLAPAPALEQVFAMASSAANPQTILAATSTSLYRSVDGGASWAQATTGLPANASVGKLVAAASDASVFYATVYSSVVIGSLTNFGVYKSSDAGQSWAPANAGIASSAIFLLTVDPTNAKLVYAATDTALLKSIDGGASWNPMAWNAGAASGYPIGLAIDPTHPSVLYASGVAQISRSADAGATWQSLRGPSELPYWSANVLLADPNRPENILVATGQSGVQQFTVAPDLSLTVAAPPSPVGVGVAAVYTYTVSNLGQFDATGVRVSLHLPATAQNIAAVASTGTCTVAGSAVSCAVGIARAGASSTITVTAAAPTTGAFQLVGSVVGEQPDPVASNNAVTTSQSVANLADLSVTASGSSTANVGDAISYTAVVANAGPDPATGTQLTYQFAQGLTSGTVSSAGAACTSGSSGMVTCVIGNLAAGKSVTVALDATATAAGTQVSTASVSSAVTDLVSANNSATNSTRVTAVVVASPPASIPTKGGGGSFAVKDLLMLALLLALGRQASGRPGCKSHQYAIDELDE
jgi:uncharacterized repeat protein (TIGR01451 family)